MVYSSLWAGADPTVSPAAYNTTQENNSSYSVAITVSETGTLKEISYYSPTGVNLATHVGVFEADNLTAILDYSTPDWGSPSGAGWITTTVPDTVLSPGTLYLVVIATTTGNALDQAYLYNGSTSQTATWVPSTSADGKITAPSSISSYTSAHGPSDPEGYHNSAGFTYTDTSVSGQFINWLIDVGINFVSDIVPGVAAHIVMAGGIGTPSAAVNANVPGVAASVDLAGGSGSVKNTSGLSWFVAENGGNGFWTTSNDQANWSSYGDMQTAIAFKVTEDGQQLSGYYYWYDTENSALIPGGFALWQCDSDPASGTLVSGSLITSVPTPTETGWQYIVLDTPVALASEQPYKVEFAATGGFYWSNSYTPFESTGIVNGLLSVFSDGGFSFPIPSTGDPAAQGSFATTTNVPGTVYPNNGYESGAPAIDVLIQPAYTPSVSIAGASAEIDMNAGVGSVQITNSVSITGVSAEMVIAGGVGHEFVLVSSPSTTGYVTTYSTFSEINNTGDAGNQDMRVLVPDSPSSSHEHAFLWLLPVEPGQGTTYGDSIATIQAINAQNDFNLTCVQPGFPVDPWYANNIDDPQTQQETFMLELAEWANRSLATTGTEKHYLIGFSKSGFGGQVLFLRNQSVFSGVISWDAACDYQTLAQYDGTDVFGTQTQLDSYKLYDPNLASWKALGDTGTVNRIQLAAGINLTAPTSDYADRLTADGILNTYTYVEADSHAWAPNPGWVGPGLARLLGAPVSISGVAAEVVLAGGQGSVTSTVPVSINGVAAQVALSGGTGSVSVNDSVNINGVAAHITIAGGLGSVTADRHVSIAGVSAAIVIAGGIGSASNSATVAISGVAAHITAAGGTGSVIASASVSGHAAALVLAGQPGSVTAHTSVAISGKAAALVFAGGHGSPLGGASARPSSLFIFSPL